MIEVQEHTKAGMKEICHIQAQAQARINAAYDDYCHHTISFWRLLERWVEATRAVETALVSHGLPVPEHRRLVR
ncbi:MAG TPA: hypothetical protein VKR06_24875 [Ktedonosporobacter sp.]|nr:hypothetical protein [Ktedonosporobacter sp.]